MIATIQALAGPAGQIDIELPHVAAALCLMLTRGDTSGVILRTFTDQVADITPTGYPIPIKHVRGWLMHGGALEPLPASEIHSSYSIAADTLEPITPDPDLEWRARGLSGCSYVENRTSSRAMLPMLPENPLPTGSE